MTTDAVPLIFDYLRAMGQHNASDLYLTVGFPATLRNDEGMFPISEGALTPDEIEDVLNQILSNRQKRDFSSTHELNSAIDMGDNGRFRVNVMQQRQHPALVIRRIISKIPSFEDLNLPPVLGNLAMEKRGLVLVTGMTSSGKSTTLASMVGYRNELHEGHIITIEDPIEYYHEHNKGVITQREVGIDTQSYDIALKNSLRQRPDVILIGEVRDRNVMEQALKISETGHLCLATLHTTNAYQSIERVVNLFPEDFQNQIRLNLALNLKAIVSQRLVPCTKGGLVVAVEILLNQGLVKELIVKGEISKIRDIMEQNNPMGMCSFDQSLLDLYRRELITEDTAISHSDMPGDMRMKIQQIRLGDNDSDGFAGMDTSHLTLTSEEDETLM